MKLHIKFGEARPIGSQEISDERLKEIVNESRWQTGTASVDGKKFACLRRKSLDGWRYELNKQAIEKVDTFSGNEYFDWRD